MLALLKKKFVGDALIYSLSPLISKLLTFILIPLYTSYLTPGDYGNLQYIMLFGAFLRGISQMGLNSAFWKFRDGDNQELNKQVALNLTVNQLGIGFFLLIIYTLIVIAFSEYSTIALFIAIYYFGLIIKTFSENTLLICRANFQAKKYIFISLVQVIITFVLNIVFVKYLSLNYQGIIYSYLIAFALTAVLFYRVLKNEFGGKYNWKISKEMINYGFPIMIGNIGLMILSLSDRWFIKYYHDDAELGLYSYGYKFADLILVFLVQIFNISFLPVAWKMSKNENAQAFLSSVRSLIYFIFPIASLIGISIILLLANVMTSNSSYLEGLDIVCIIGFSHVFYGFYLFHSIGLQFVSKTKYILLTNMIAVILNVLLNILLIPKYGMIGASVATVLSYFIMLIITILISQKHYKLEFSTLKIILYFIFTAVILSAISMLFFKYEGEIIYKSIITLIGAAVLGVLLYLTSGLNKKTFQTLKELKI